MILVGDVPRLEREVGEYGRGRPASVSFVDAPEVVEMGSRPLPASDDVGPPSGSPPISSVTAPRTPWSVPARRGHDGRRCLPPRPRGGIDRPALPAYFLTPSGPLVLLDVGANVDSTPENLVQFGAMGSLYAERVLHVTSPQVALLNIGEEAEKGDTLSREAFVRLEGSI